MQYIESYKFPFRSPNWVVNLLLVMVAPMVPIVGPMVVLGYQFDIIEWLHRRGDGDYPDFDFNKLGQYLMRGLWPLLVQLIMILPLVAVGMVFYLIFWFGLAMAASNQSSAGTMVVLLLGFGAMLFFFALELAVMLCLVPMTLRAGLMANFGAGFSWAFIRDFLGRMWGVTLLTELFLLFSGMVLISVGMLFCGLGIYPAAALMQFARAHLLYQLYEEYLKRGGEEIPLPAAPVPTVDYPDDEEGFVKGRDDETGYTGRR